MEWIWQKLVLGPLWKWLALVTIHQPHKYHIIMCPSLLWTHTIQKGYSLSFNSTWNSEFLSFNFGFFCCFHTFQQQFISFHISHSRSSLAGPWDLKQFPFNYVCTIKCAAVGLLRAGARVWAMCVYVCGMDTFLIFIHLSFDILIEWNEWNSAKNC